MLLMPEDIEKKKREQAAAAAKKEREQSVQSLLMPEPLSPMEQANEKYGKGETSLRRLGNLLTGGLFDSAIIPELSTSNRAKYKTDLDVFAEQRKMNLVDMQDEAYAQILLDPNATIEEKMAAAVRAGGVDKLNPNSKTLSPNQVMVGPTGDRIADGNAPIVQPGDIERRANAFAEGYGIKPGTQAYSDIIAAFSEPTHTKTGPDGTQTVYNTIDLVKENIANGVYEGIGPNAAGAAQAGAGTSSSQNITPEDLEVANLRTQAMEWDNEKQAESEEKGQFYSRLTEQMDKMGAYNPETGEFVATDELLDIYGSLDSKWPEWARGDKERHAQALVDQITEILAVDERGKLKGQGQITEGETQMLRESLTILTNMGIGDEDVQKELARLYRTVLEQQENSRNFRSRNPYRQQLEARVDGLPPGFEVDQ